MHDDATDRSIDRGTIVAWIATTLALVLATRGPMYRIRLEFPGETTGLLDDNWVQASAYAVYGVAIVANRRALGRVWRDARILVLAHAALIAVFVASTAWSIDRWRTIEQSLIMGFGVAALALAAARLSPIALLTAVWTATSSCVLVSVWARWRDWPLSLDRRGDMTGVFYNRNLLGACACVAVLSSVALVWHWRGWTRFAAATTGVVSLAVWWRAQSMTPIVSLVCAVAAGAFTVLWMRADAPLRRRLRPVPAVVTLVGLVGFAFRDTVTGWFGRSPSLTGRTGLWTDVLSAIGRRPIEGYGFFAGWFDPQLRADLAARRRNLWEAHNGYLEVALGGGAVAVAALVVALVVTVAILRRAIERGDEWAPWWVAVAVYALVVNLGETNIAANRVPWMLLVAVGVQAIGRVRS